MGSETSQPQREITRRSKRLVAADQVVAPTELTGFVDPTVDVDVSLAVMLDHTPRPMSPVLMSPILMSIIHTPVAIGTEHAIGAGRRLRPAPLYL
jgi:hypothetical protein